MAYPFISQIEAAGSTYDISDAYLRTSTASAYSTSSSYAVGDYCIKDGTIYKCNTAIGSGETWTSSHWTAVQIMTELQNTQGGAVHSADQLTTKRTIDGVKFNGTVNVGHYAQCTTDASTTAKTATIYVPGTTSLAEFTLDTGARVTVHFTKGVSVGAATLAINGTTAKNIQYKGANITSSMDIPANTTVDFVYNGSAWQLVGEILGDVEYSASDLGTNKTITALSQTDGKISATASSININASQVGSGTFASARFPVINVAHGGTGNSTFTTSRVVVTNATSTTGALTVSSITTTELGYLSGVTSNIQTQINNISHGGTDHVRFYKVSTATSATSLIPLGNIVGSKTLSEGDILLTKNGVLFAVGSGSMAAAFAVSYQGQYKIDYTDCYVTASERLILPQYLTAVYAS